MSVPKVAIVGRPNVGKSSIMNWLAHKRVSVVDPMAGVTRDRVTYLMHVEDRYFELVDTGGIGIVDVGDLTEEIDTQIRIGIEQADLILFVVDGSVGITALDEEVARRLRAIQKPVVLVANKADTDKLSELGGDFFRLGYGAPLCVSADQKLGKFELFDAIAAKLPPDTGELPPEDATLMLAIVGRRNVGKSTFINALAEAERVIVSEVPGTTRDSIDVRFERDGKAFVAIDTAGVRKKTSIASGIEFYSAHRAERSVRRADVVLHFFDARHRVGRVDKQLAHYILENNKPAIFVVNKWDLVKDAMETERMGKYIRTVFPMLDYVPIAFVTAKKGKNALRLLQLAVQLHKQASSRVGTGELNRVIKHAMEVSTPPMRNNKAPRVFYATQVGANPPTVVLFTNGPDLFDDTYLRYLTKVLRDSFTFAEVAIKLVLRAKGEGGGARLQAEEEDGVVSPDETTDEVEEPIVRAKPVKKPKPAPPVVEAPPRKKKPKNAETWDL